MSTAVRPSFNRDQGFLLKVMVVWLIAIVIGCNIFTAKLQDTSVPPLPFGVVQNKEGTLLQDFGYNILFLRGINDHLIGHPYRLEDQEVLMRQLLPTLTGGMSHAYSPVTLVVVQPLLLLPGQGTYIVFTILSAIGIYFLFRLSLLPRAIDRLQLLALVICALSLWFPSAFLVGQTSILTVTLVGFGWWLLRENAEPRRLSTDILIALLFWSTCMKPNVAIILFMVLLGARAWRPLGIAIGMLGVTWLITANHYGGIITGLRDYADLLSHYSNAWFTPYMQRIPQTDETRFWGKFYFTLERHLILLFGATLVLLRWMKKITLAELFEGMIWIFLLLSPYLMPTENWIFCLIVVERSFFLSKGRLINFGKLLLLVCIFNLRDGFNIHLPIEYPLKWALFTWIFIEWVLERRAIARGEPSRELKPALE